MTFTHSDRAGGHPWKGSPPFLLFLAVFLLTLSPALPGAQEDYVIGSEDVVEIIVWGHDDLERTMPVSLTGMISFPLIGEVKAEGLSATDLAGVIARKLSDGYIVNPQVTVTVREYKSQRVFLMGEINNPGTYTVTRENNILFALSQAGGPTKDAGENIVIIRPGRSVDRALTLEEAQPNQDQIIQVNLKDALAGDSASNIAIRDGDSIIVPRMPFFFVTGEVSKPGRYNLERNTTVLMAITMAGGLTAKAAPKRTRITREENGAKMEFRADMETKVLPGDTIVVPESFF